MAQDLLRRGLSTPQIPALGSLMIPYAELALRGTRFNYESKYILQQACTRGLDSALGGIYDHVERWLSTRCH